MIIPIGHENSEVRRYPWVTFGIIALCTLALVVTGSEQARVEQELGETAERLHGYIQSHPYLEIEARVDDLLFADFDEQEREELFAVWLEEAPEPYEFQLNDEQRELDAMQESFLSLFDELPSQRLGLVPAEPSAKAFVTHMFMHGGWIHLLGNMFLLFLVGACIEDVWGRPLFAAFYALAGVFAAGFFALQYLQSTIPLVGASGAVSGILGAFLVRYWSTKIKFFYWVGLFFRGTFSAPAWVMLPLWFLNEVLSARMMDELVPGGSGGGVAHWAHVGGFLFGVGGAFAIKKLEIEERFVRPALEAKVDLVSNRALEEALAAKQAGKPDEAFARLAREAREQPGNVDAAVTLWELGIELGRAREAAPALVRVLRADVQNGDADRALERLAELHQHARDVALEPQVLLRLAMALAKDGRGREAAGVLRRAVPDARTPLPPAVAVRIANAARPLDPEVAARAARIALGARDLDPRERANLEAMVQAAPAEQERAPSADPAVAPRRGPAPIDIGRSAPAPAEILGDVSPDEAPSSEPWSLAEDDEPFDKSSSADLGAGTEPQARPTPAASPSKNSALDLFDHSALDLGSSEGDDAPLELDSPGAGKADTSTQRDVQDPSALDLGESEEGGAGFLRPADPGDEKEPG
jgi:membrane associated rhomboid family serine protease